MALYASKNLVVCSRMMARTNFTRTLANHHQSNKGPMDYVKQGVDQLNQAATKVKEVVSNATSTVVEAVAGEQNENNRPKNDFEKTTGKMSTQLHDRNPDEDQMNSSRNKRSSTFAKSFSEKSDDVKKELNASMKTTGQQAQHYRDETMNKAHETAEDFNSSMKHNSKKASDWIKDNKEEFSSNAKRSTDSAINKSRDAVKNLAEKAADHLKSADF